MGSISTRTRWPHRSPMEGRFLGAAAEWLEKRGLVVHFFTATPEAAIRLIQNGIAFVLTLESDEKSHAVAVVGLDESKGTLLIHDPGGSARRVLCSRAC